MSFVWLSARRPISTPVWPCPIAPPGPAKSTFSPKAALSLSVLSRDSPSVAWLLRLNTASKRISAYATPRWARRKRRSAGPPASLRNPIASKMSFDAIAKLVEPPRNHTPLRATRRALRVVSLYDLHSAMDEGVKVRRRYSGEGRRSVLEAGSSQIRLAPSPGVQQGSNGIQGRAGGRSPRMYKEGREHRGRDSRAKSSKGPQMLVAGIDIGAESHHVAVVDRAEAVVVKATAFAENAAGYQGLFALLARAGARGGADLPPGGGERRAGAHVGGDGGHRPLLAELVCRAGRPRLRSGVGQSVAHSSLRRRGAWRAPRP